MGTQGALNNNQGTQGAQGTQGPPGQGLQGAQGPQGPQGPIAGSFSVSGIPNLLIQTDQNNSLYQFDEKTNISSEFVHTVSGSPFSYTVPANGYRFVNIEVIAQSRVEQVPAVNSKVSFIWKISTGLDSKTFTPKIISTSSVGGGVSIDQYSFMYKGGGGGGSLGDVTISVTTTMSVANANVGAKILSFRVYGIDDYTFGAGPQGMQGTQGAEGSQGAQGLDGLFAGQGSQGTSVQGAQGTQGTFGPPTIPQSSSTTLISSTDNGKFIPITGGVFLPNPTFNTGENVVIYNNTSSKQLITPTGGNTLRLAGTALSGNRYIEQRGLATIICVGSADYVISGAGVT